MVIMETVFVKEHVVTLLVILTGQRNLADLCWALTTTVADADHG